jgi:hypothetical protein
MISKSKLGAIAFIAAIGFASPALAQLQLTPVANYGPSNYAPSQAGGGSAGYNHHLSTDYRLKQHNTHAHRSQ